MPRIKQRISKRLVTQWKMMHKHGDISRISAEYGLTRPTIRSVLRTGKGTIQTIEAITKFYEL